ncbi:phosphoglycerate mutase family protein [Clostridium hydrogeniformans]|uniref:phosphoglycerate mutase family protein n=1 Tax=Clostridium hydrogeniformans TaxID=349933 RepID=UPI0004814EEA|nr:phosphoglycerate mutase family protein [Clostridium hydrogeniformans]
MKNNITTLLIVRHADIDIPTEIKDDRNIILNERGEKRAENLAKVVGKAPVVVYTSTVIRSIQTAEPLLEKLSIENRKNDEYEKIVEDILLNYEGKVVLIVHHSNSIPKIIEKFTGESNHVINGFDDFYIVNFYHSEDIESNHANVIHLKYDV